MFNLTRNCQTIFHFILLFTTCESFSGFISSTTFGVISLFYFNQCSECKIVFHFGLNLYCSSDVELIFICSLSIYELLCYVPVWNIFAQLKVHYLSFCYWFIEVLYIFSIISFFFFGYTASLWDLSFLTKDWTQVLSSERPNHWSTREFPG